ncbi:MAG TPA: acetylornithine transaminase [Dermatophilaceae bacterium]|nr:acetylornithine transaminase [Dermatophilaceae bacterium]
MSQTSDLLERYEHSLLGVFGRPRTVLTHGEGCSVWDADGNRYLDLLGGIAVNALGHNHPAVVKALAEQASQLVHVSNFFTTTPQVELAERLLTLTGAPTGSAVFLVNSGTEAVEAALKLSRRTGRTGLVALEGAFHGRSTGALALTHKPAYREPFAPLMPSVTFVPPNDQDALRAAVSDQTAAVFVEPIQGEAGVRPVHPAYLRLARELTREHGALLVVDEIQTGVGRTGDWFAVTESGVRPDAMTLAKGLGGGVPVGALVTFGEQTSGLLSPGQHGTTFGGNPLASAVALAVLDTIERDGLVAHARQAGDRFASNVAALRHPRIVEVRGRGLLRVVQFDADIAVAVTARAEAAGFIVNPVTPDAIRLAPPLVVTDEELDTFVATLPRLLEVTP